MSGLGLLIIVCAVIWALIGTAYVTLAEGEPLDYIVYTIVGLVASLGVVVVAVVATVLIQAVMFPITLLYAYTGWCLWGWFAVPAGAPALSMWHVYGIDMIVTFFTVQINVTHYLRAETLKPTKDRFITWLGLALSIPIGFLTLGYFIHHYLM